MNLRNVLRAYSLLRQLGDDESALLNILRTLNDSDREQLIATMSDKPQKKLIVKRVLERCMRCDQTRRADEHKNTNLEDYHEFVVPPAGKKSAGGGGKSKRASSLGDTIRTRTQSRTVTADNELSEDEKQAAREMLEDDDLTSESDGLCIVGIDSRGETCGMPADHNSHHLATHPDYHEFKPYVPRAAAGSGD